MRLEIRPIDGHTIGRTQQWRFHKRTTIAPPPDMHVVPQGRPCTQSPE